MHFLEYHSTCRVCLCYSARFLPKTADMLLTMPLMPPFLRALASLIRSNSSWNTSRTPWYASAADISKKPQSADKARSRPSSLETVRWCWRSRLLPTIMMGETPEVFFACLMRCTCCRTTSKLEVSHMLYTRIKPSAHCNCFSVIDSVVSQFWKNEWIWWGLL